MKYYYIFGAIAVLFHNCIHQTRGVIGRDEGETEKLIPYVIAHKTGKDLANTT